MCVCEYSVAQLCLTLCDPVDCSQQGSSVYGILQARILEWAAISFFVQSNYPPIKINKFKVNKYIILKIILKIYFVNT